MTDRALMADMVNSLEQLKTHVEQTACTCPSDGKTYDRNHRTRRGRSECAGVQLADKYRVVIRQAHRRLAKRFQGESGFE